MSYLITPTYTFTPGASGVGTINLSGIVNFSISNLAGIVDVTNNTVIYARGVTGFGYTALSGTTLTLSQTTTTLASTDVLAIKYDVNGGNDGFIPFGSPFSTTSATNLFSIDTTGFASICTHTTSNGVATVVYEGSNDNVNWIAVYGANNSSNGSSAPSNTDTGTVARTFAAEMKYFRARVSSYTSGTVTIAIVLRTVMQNFPGVFVQGSVTSVTGKSTTGGLTQFPYRVATASVANSAVIKASAGQIYGYHFINNATSTRYIHFYNTTTVPTMGTTADARIVGIPASSSVFYNASDIGIAFSTGISIAVTTSYTTTDNTVSSIAAGDVIGMIDYN